MYTYACRTLVTRSVVPSVGVARLHHRTRRERIPRESAAQDGGAAVELQRHAAAKSDGRRHSSAQ